MANSNDIQTRIDTDAQANIAAVDANAQAAILRSDTFLANLVDTMEELEDIPYITSFENFRTYNDIIITAEKPDRPDIPEDFDSIDTPDTPSLVIPTIDIENIPELLATEPAITLPPVPDSGLPNVPSKPDILDINVPSKPVLTLPSVPSIKDIVIPDPPSIEMPVFEGTLPVNDLVAPSETFEFNEVDYISELLDAIEAKLLNDVENGGTGLAAEIEDAIWQRNQERDELALADLEDKTIDEWSKRGFPLPDGVIRQAILEIWEKHKNALLDRSREIATEQARLAQTNTHFAIERGIAFEAMMIQHHNNVAERALRTAAATVELAVAVFNAKVVHYNSRLQAYQTSAVVYESKIRAELSKVEVFKAQLEGKRIESAIQEQLINIYRAQIESVNSLINVYRVEMEAANVQANIERSKMEIFRSEIDAYSQQVAAKIAEFQLYRSKIDGEMAKVEIYEAQVRAYNASIEGHKANADIRATKVRAEIDIEKLKIDAYRSDIDKFRSEITAEAERIRSIANTYGMDIRAYNSDISVSEANARIKLGKIGVEARFDAASIDAELSRVKANLDAFLSTAALRMKSSEMGAKIYSEYAASIANSLQTLVTMGSHAEVTKTESDA